MGRDPDEGAAFVFDLVDDEAADADAPTSPAGADGDDSQEGEPPPGGLGPRWRRAVPVVTVLAIALGTGIAVDGVRDAARMERMRDVSGGVTDLSSPLDVMWAWTGAVDLGEGTTDVAVLGDELVFESEGRLVALDPATGDETWTVSLGEDPECGPMASPAWDDPRTPSLVCLQGRVAEREAMVVGPGGATSAPRVLGAADAAEHGLPHTGPDGTVLRGRRAGPASEVDRDVTCDLVGECSGYVRTGRDLVLRAEDAVTGEERWTVTVPFRVTEAVQCTRRFGGEWGGSENRVDLSGQLDPDAFGARVWSDLVNVEGCGVQAAVTPDGVLLGAELEPGTSYMDALGTGGYLGTSWSDVPRTTLYDADGDVVAEVSGYVIVQKSTDESGAAVLLAIDDLGRRLSAYETDGTARWDIALQSSGQEFLAQVGETVVITTGAGTVRGLDLATGEGEWLWDGSTAPGDSDGGYFGTAYVVQTFTDGELVLLLTETDGTGTRGMVALDAATGEMVWEQAGGGAAGVFDPRGGDVLERGVTGDLIAVDGNLLEVSSVGVRRLG
ncbi:putative pyrroloquinoline-quinone binding quinoprotein [Promicromonospora sp. AC04]|uniref:outer membrane protein assembly factor BamB family protein n=1 Tax=Promicromonospora sp. AC04 TaxID=2135723 RepID=UPI000D3509FD|nr:PQQ-binding-like beta-propeller repeat protein [Promicromonospora sp. AC04]PUB28963.1 putative pyrroloquinoline-quinone binding quinoprotein [Promicromonospora sp. AC04]